MVNGGFDPTRTTALRNAFAADMKRRFIELKSVIRFAIIDQDCFKLNPPVPIAYQVTPPGHNAFNFPRSADKVKAFMEWLKQQQKKGLLQVKEIPQIGEGIEKAWTDKYIEDSYKRGVIRTRYEMKKSGMNIPSIGETGGIFMSMQSPFHIDRLGLLYSRTFSELQGVTEAMDQQISRVLAQGIGDGDNPRLLARRLVSTIDGTGMGELGITDRLGRFIPAQRRAMMIARTEIIRAHAEAQLQEYKNWGVEGLELLVELVTAGYNVCPECEALAGQVFNIDEASGVIPVHPNCRCAWIPVKKEKEKEGGN
jgi:SPP1 gp7 family putative phage head morphogenesis protein